MALNFSHRPVFPTHTSGDSLVSPLRTVNGYLVESVPENNWESFSMPWHFSRGETDERNFNYERDKADRHCSPESTAKDIVDRLPSDPFGMDIETTFTAITGWLEDLEVDCGAYMRNNNSMVDKESYGLFAEWNWIWDGSLKFQQFPGNFQLTEKLNTVNEKLEDAVNSEGGPHEALPFALSYLGVKDLLSVQRVCKLLFSTVRDDPLLWMNINIVQPLNEKITDDVLLKLVSRAQGKLQCLSLVECPKVTNDGLRHILETNPHLTKVCVPGCTRITIECIVNSIKAYNSNRDFGGIKHLRIGGLYGMNHQHFEELKLLLRQASDNKIEESHHKRPHFYHGGNFYLPHDDERAIDIEMCPICEKFRLVYDCPVEACKDNKDKPARDCCRACTICIPRCAQCGRCMNDTVFEETFCLELVCSDCVNRSRSRINTSCMKSCEKEIIW